MAVTFTASANDFDTQMGGLHSGVKIVCGQFNLDSSYAASGGEAVVASDIDSRATTIVELLITNSRDAVILYSWDAENSKIIAYDALATEESAAANLSADAKSGRFVAFLT